MRYNVDPGLINPSHSSGGVPSKSDESPLKLTPPIHQGVINPGLTLSHPWCVKHAMAAIEDCWFSTRMTSKRAGSRHFSSGFPFQTKGFLMRNKHSHHVKTKQIRKPLLLWDPAPFALVSNQNLPKAYHFRGSPLDWQ